MKRVRPTNVQYGRLMKLSAHRCCVCKRRDVGLHLHHIDGNNTHTTDDNLAVICVEDHDRHHRPGKYKARINHAELSAAELKDFKADWESFVAEAQAPEPKVFATLSAYGTIEQIHSLQLVMQWPDERIAMKQSYHLLNGDLDRLTDEVFDDLTSIGPNVKIAIINEPLAVEHCPCCGTGQSRTLKSAVAARLIDSKWVTESSASIYINPLQPSLAIVISLSEKEMYHGHLHLCGGRYLHYHGLGIDERVPVKQRPSVRAQACQIVRTVLKEWKPAMVFIGTGDPDDPQIINDLTLPKFWEEHRGDAKRKKVENRS